MTKTTSPPPAVTLDLEALERLAREAAEVHRLGADWDDHSMGVAPVCAAFFAALNPAVVLRLIAAARLGEAWEAAEAAAEARGWRIWSVEYDGRKSEWRVIAGQTADHDDDRAFLAIRTGPSPTAALTALATALSEAKP